jgi:hypothetical protein
VETTSTTTTTLTNKTMSANYMVSEEEWFALGLDATDDEPEEVIEVQGWDDHPSLTAEERNPSLRNTRRW